MLRLSHVVKLCTGVALVALVASAVAVTAGAKPKPPPGKAKGKAKVVLCHKGTTIRVGAPAVKAHLRHGDKPGPCGAPAPAPGTAAIDRGQADRERQRRYQGPRRLTLTINGVTATGGNSFAGSTIEG